MTLIDQIQTGTIIRLATDPDRDWVCIYHTQCDMTRRVRYRKNVPNHTGYYLFGGLWYEGDPLTDQPYGKCLEQLEQGMMPHISIVGDITNPDHQAQIRAYGKIQTF